MMKYLLLAQSIWTTEAYIFFENAVFIYNKATALSVKQDMLNNFEAGHEVTADYAKDVISH